jgi:Zn-dependent protease
VSTTTPDLIRNCKRCGRELAPGALACGGCHALVHSHELERLAAEAKALEARGELQQAREKWLTGLDLLPPESKQADWIKRHVAELSAAGDTTQMDTAPLSDARIQAAAQIGPVSVLDAKRGVPRTARVNLASLLSFVAFIAIYWAASGMKFGVGFAVLILIHEMGHFVDIKRRGLPADMPVFLPGLGAYVRWQALGVSIETRAAISLAGPLAGLLASVACAALWWQTGNPLWAELARVGAILNLLNLIPVWVLDGGQAVLALGKNERIILGGTCVALGLVLGQNMFFLVALGAGYQAVFAGDLPARASRVTTIYYLAVLIALGVMIRLMPGTGLGLR